MNICNFNSIVDTVWLVLRFLFIDFKHNHGKGFFKRVPKTYYTLKADFLCDSYGKMKFMEFSSNSFHPQSIHNQFNIIIIIFLTFILLFQIQPTMKSFSNAKAF
jgi:hypothetical protein